MRITINIDDALLEAALEISGVSEHDILLCEGLKALIERETGRRLAGLGGSEPLVEVPARRRSTEVPRRNGGAR